VASDYEFILQQVRQGRDFQTAEEDRFPFNHTEVGHVIGERWNFSDELNQAIRLHHRPWEELQEGNYELVGIIKASDLIVHASGLGFGKEYARFSNKTRLMLDDVWKYLSIGPDDGREILREGTRMVEQELDLYTA
jgi:hypothetical protein